MRVGVIVGRFQMAVWSEAYRRLVERVGNEHDVVVIAVLVSGALSQRNVLDWPMRLAATADAIKATTLDGSSKQALVVPVLVTRDPVDWSRALDDLLWQMLPGATFQIYGDDRCRPQYCGRHDTAEVALPEPQEPEYRVNLTQTDNTDFRAGVLHGASLFRARTLLAVDVAIFRNGSHGAELLLGRKRGESGWRLPGGAVEPGETLEMAARREVMEETGIPLELGRLFQDRGGVLNYVGSYRVPDWRYPDAEAPISALFLTVQTAGVNAAAGDDLPEVGWFDVPPLRTEWPLQPFDDAPHVVEEHRLLVHDAVRAYSQLLTSALRES